MSEVDNRLQTFDESELPDWAIHEDDQEGLNAFFNEPADRGDAETAFAIPRVEAGAPVPLSAPAHARVPELASSPDPTNVEAHETADVPAPAPEPAAVPEHSFEPEAATAPSPEPEPAAVAEPTLEAVPEPTPEPAPEPQAIPEQESASDSAAPEEEPEASHDVAAPRRADFAKFRCIYESQDGQLALYEDEDGHLTAVNTNRFV